VLQGECWAAAFDRNGFNANQTCLSTIIRRELQLEGAVAVPSTRPTAEQLSHCFPRRARVPTAALWRPVDHPRAAGSAPRERRPTAAPLAIAAAAAPVARPAADGRVYGRTRAETRRLTALAMGASP
jgi:hypothetical protein